MWEWAFQSISDTKIRWPPNVKVPLVIIDDIWQWEEWEVICKALPKNNVGCKLIMTTRIWSIAEKCHNEQGAGVHIHLFDHADAERLGICCCCACGFTQQFTPSCELSSFAKQRKVILLLITMGPVTPRMPNRSVVFLSARIAIQIRMCWLILAPLLLMVRNASCMVSPSRRSKSCGC